MDSDSEIDKKAHKRLLESIGATSKTKLIKKPTRNEPSLKKSEFHLVKTKSNITAAVASVPSIGPISKKGQKRHTIVKSTSLSQQNELSVPNLINVLKQKKVKHSRITNNLKEVKKLLEKPLEKPIIERNERKIAYDRAKTKLNRWNAVITANRASDQLRFPLQKFVPVREIASSEASARLSDQRIKTDLMIKMEEILKTVKPQEDKPPELTVAQKNRQAMLERSRELRMLRMRESQRNAKARLQNKIKSKKYHKLMRREKLKQQMREFEALQKIDPEAALQKINQLDKQRITERANLRHKNTGTWAKSLKVRSTYDKDVRKELAQQLAIGRELTQKQQNNSSDDDDTDDDKNNDVNTSVDPFNPWMKNVNPAENNDSNFVSYRTYWETRNENEKQMKKYLQEMETNTENTIQDKNPNDNTDLGIDNDKKTIKKLSNGISGKSNDCKKSKKPAKKTVMKQKSTSTLSKPATKRTNKDVKLKLSNDNIDNLFDEAEEIINEKVDTKIKKIKSNLERDKQRSLMDTKKNRLMKKKKSKVTSTDIDLSFKIKNKRPVLDEELTLNDDNLPNETNNLKKLKNQLKSTKRQEQQQQQKNLSDSVLMNNNINTDNFINMKPINLQTAIPDLMFAGGDDNDFDDVDDEDGQRNLNNRMTIAAAFEDDDIVADFNKNYDENNKDKEIKDIDLTLPGWGSWGGAGILPNQQRKKVLKFSNNQHQKQQKANVILNEKVPETLRKHLVADLPFPFKSVKDYEASIRAPIGKTFVPMTANRVLTRPAILTKLGRIIEPITDEFLITKPELRKRMKSRSIKSKKNIKK